MPPLAERARTSAVGAVASAPAAVLMLVVLQAAHELRWGLPPAALAVALAAFLGPYFALARAGRLHAERIRTALGVSAAIVFCGAGIALVAVWLMPARAWWVAGAAVVLVAPSAVFSTLDGATRQTWLQRVAIGVLSLLPGYAAALAVSVGWLGMITVRVPENLEFLFLLAPGLAVGHGVVFFGATLPVGTAGIASQRYEETR
jgi:hypothetical protein